MTNITLNHERSAGMTGRAAWRITLVLLMLVASTPAAWSQWQPLGPGFVGSKHQPPALDTTEVQRLEHARTVARENLLKANRNGALWLRTQEEGLYRLSVADLAAHMGYPVRDLRQWLAQGQRLTLINAGVTKPWYYEPGDGLNGSPGDSLYFVGEPYETFYTETNAYHLRDDGSPEVMGRRAGPAPYPGTPNRPFRETLKLEQEPEGMAIQWAVMDDPDADYWFWDYLYPPFVPSVSVTLDIPGASALGQGELRILLRGATDFENGDDHRVTAQLNGIPVGDAVEWDGFSQKLLRVPFSQSLLDPSGSNTLTLISEQLGSDVSLQLLDDVEVSYWRKPYAEAGQLWLHGLNAGYHTVGGFLSPDIQVIEAPGTNQASWRTDFSLRSGGGGSWQVTFSATDQADYLVVDGTAVRSPVMEADVPSDLANQYDLDYLIIAPRELTKTAEELLSYRSERFPGAQIAWLDDVYDEFSAGRVDPHALRVFLSQPRSEFVTLLGKGTIDHKNRLGHSDSLLPIPMAITPWGVAGSDNRLMDNDGDDVIDFAYGRIPVQDDDAGLRYLNKLIAYEAAPRASRQSVVVADNPDNAGEYHANADALTAQLHYLGYTNPSRLYHCVTPEQHEACADVRSSLIDSNTWDAAFVSYVGHGGVTQMGTGSESFLLSTDVEYLSNRALPVFSAMTCAVGDDSQPGWDALAAALVRRGSGGAIASFAPTGLSYDQDAHSLGTEFMEAFLGGRLSIGEAAREAQWRSAGRVHRFMLRIYQVIGDPAVEAR